MSSIIKSDRVRVEARRALQSPAPPAQPGTASAPATACEKTVRLLELEGRVHALELVCSCGEVTVVEFDYPSAASPELAQPESRKTGDNEETNA